MKSLDKIPTTKIQRAAKLVKVGVQVSGNYVKYLGDKLVNDSDSAQERLDKNNAKNIYDGLSELKGSALKMAQMMSMDQSLLPTAYVEQFSLAQFNVPPLSGPLVRKTVSRALGAAPESLFDSFNYESKYAASIGQVHEAFHNDNQLAVKVQYPGVASSISSDLKLVKPFAMRMFNLKGDNIDIYFKEVEEKLLEETNYLLEAKQLQETSDSCSHIAHLRFPEVYPNLSSDNVLSMEWINGLHVSEFVKTNASKEARNQVAQTLWDFYMFQMHNLKKVHADPHPGNFLITNDHQLVALDFGCMKAVPQSFYESYFSLTKPENIENQERLSSILMDLEMLREDDSDADKQLIFETFQSMLGALNKPFMTAQFDFGGKTYLDEIMALGNELKDNKLLRKLNGNRGSKHFLYINRTLFGLISMMNMLDGGEIDIDNYKNYSYDS